MPRTDTARAATPPPPAATKAAGDTARADSTAAPATAMFNLPAHATGSSQRPEAAPRSITA